MALIGPAATAAANWWNSSEILAEKARLAQETFASRQALKMLSGWLKAMPCCKLSVIQTVAFCFLDAEKALYTHAYDLVIPNLAPAACWWLITRSATRRRVCARSSNMPCLILAWMRWSSLL